MKKSFVCVVVLIFSFLFVACNRADASLNYDDSDFAFGNAVLTQEVDDVFVLWQNGNVTIKTTGNEISINETNNDNFQLRYKIDNKTLYVYYASAKTKLNGTRKDLELTLPTKVYEKIDVTIKNGDFKANVLTARDTDLTINGSINIENAAGTNLNLSCKNATLTQINYLKQSLKINDGKLNALTVIADEIELNYDGDNAFLGDLSCNALTVNGKNGNLTIGFSDKVGGYETSANVLNGEIVADGKKDETTYVYKKNGSFAYPSVDINVNLTNGNLGLVFPK